MTLAPRGRAIRTLLLVTVGGPFLSVLAAWAPGADTADQLILSVILTRHGVRSPLQTNEALASLAAQPWPTWEVAPGIQTPHGNALIAAMGDYYHQYLAEAGALTGDPSVDGPHLFIRADNDERTLETGRILGKSLVLVGEPEVHALPEGRVDPLFQPVKAQLGHPNAALGIAAVLGRMGGDPRRVDAACATQLALLKGVLYGPGGAPAGSAAFDGPTTVVPGSPNSVVGLAGPLRSAVQCIEALTLEFADGMPASDVGWGRVDERVLTDLLALHGLYFDLTQRTFYPAQVQGSNLASHLIDTLEQGALGLPVPGALGPVGERVVVLVGHDTNIANLGGMLGLDWWLPGTQANPVLPGGALVFELWRHGSEANAAFVRVSYVGATLAQLRAGTALSLNAPPARSPIFVPGCSAEAPGYAAPLAAFVRTARHVIDPAFISEEP
jgi:4-phytase / acid phosphatase